jgi:hypothetical protein
LKALLQERLKQEIHVVERPQYIVSSGAALTAKQHYNSTNSRENGNSSINKTQKNSINNT